MMEAIGPDLFLALVGLIALGVFANGLRFYNGAERLAPKLRADPALVRRGGLAQMVGAPLFFTACFALLASGAVDLSRSGGQ